MVREMENTEMGVTPFSQPGKATGETSEVFQTWGVTVQSEYHHMLWPLQSPDQGLKKKGCCEAPSSTLWLNSIYNF